MIIRFSKNTSQEFDTNKLTSFRLAATAVVAILVSTTAYAQTNPSSGINRQSAGQATTSAPKSAAQTTVKPAKRKRSAAVAKITRRKHTAAPRTVKVTIHGNSQDARAARQQGIQSLQSTNAEIAARKAATEAAASAAEENSAALANARNNFQTPYYGNVPPFLDPTGAYSSAYYGGYGSTSTAAPLLYGVPTLGTPIVNFPSYYTTYNPGMFSTYSTYNW